MAQIEIGLGKSARRAYGLDEITIVPSRRTRNTADIDISWEIDAYKLDLPMLAAGMDSVVSPNTAIAIGRLGGCGVLNLEGLWTRYENPESVLDEMARLSDEQAKARLHEIYSEPIKTSLISERISQIKQSGVITAASLSPRHVDQYAKALTELDLFVIKGWVVSAEHVTRTSEALNMKRFIREFSLPVVVGGCASYQSALHLMRTGAAGVLVGVGSSAPSATDSQLGVGVPQATAIADVRGARMRHLDETGIYCHVIADGGITKAGDIAKAIVCGADAVMIGTPLAAAHEAPGRGFHWSTSSAHHSLPLGGLSKVEQSGTLEEILIGPAHDDEGRTNLFGALRTSMATTGYESLKDFQKAEIVVSNQSEEYA